VLFFVIRFWNCSDTVLFFVIRLWNCSDTVLFFVIRFWNCSNTVLFFCFSFDFYNFSIRIGNCSESVVFLFLFFILFIDINPNYCINNVLGVYSVFLSYRVNNLNDIIKIYKDVLLGQSMSITTNVVSLNSFMRGIFDTALCNKVCQCLATGRWFSLGIPGFLHQ
jgi:hypothetical protein